jgi:tetratricopeptide (TPR) repeat protein
MDAWGRRPRDIEKGHQMATTADDVETEPIPAPGRSRRHSPSRPAEVVALHARRAATSPVRHRRRWVLLGTGAVALAAAVTGIVIASGRGDDGGAAAVTEDTVKLSENPVVASYQTQLPALAEAVAQNPKDAKALRDYGVALYATGDVSRAKEQYEAEQKVNPDDAVLLNNLGNVYRDLGSYDQALESYQKSISLDPTSPTPYINLANLYQYTLKQPELSIKTLQEAMSNLPDNQDLGVLLGIAYEQTGDTASAKQAFQSVLDQNPQNPAATAGMARIGS